MRYGSLEYRYAAPFADALVNDGAFRRWVLQQTKFASDADGAEVLHEQMRARRSSASATWWRSHFTEACRCPGCSGQETDLLAIFGRQSGNAFALHCEVKQPTDNFPVGKDQAASYLLRARCWIGKPPKAIVPHADAQTLLLCSKHRLSDYAPDASKFNVVMTFEDIGERFPYAVPP